MRRAHFTDTAMCVIRTQVMKVGRMYYQNTADARPFDKRWREAIHTILSTFRAMQVRMQTETAAEIRSINRHASVLATDSPAVVFLPFCADAVAARPDQLHQHQLHIPDHHSRAEGHRGARDRPEPPVH